MCFRVLGLKQGRAHQFRSISVLYKRVCHAKELNMASLSWPNEESCWHLSPWGSPHLRTIQWAGTCALPHVYQLTHEHFLEVIISMMFRVKNQAYIA